MLSQAFSLSTGNKQRRSFLRVEIRVASENAPPDAPLHRGNEVGLPADEKAELDDSDTDSDVFPTRSASHEPSGSENFLQAANDPTVEFLTHDTSKGDDRARQVRKSKQLDSVRPPDFIYPPSHYGGYIAPFSIYMENEVIEEFKTEFRRQKLEASNTAGDYYVELNLSQFSVYQPLSLRNYGGTMTGLQTLSTKIGNYSYCFDGILSFGLQKRYVQGVPFKICSIGNYGPVNHSIGDNIWIQSELNQGSQIYYHLKSPSSEYKRYHAGFLWLANLGKHFVDFLENHSMRGKLISLRHFESDFISWLEKKHSTSETYISWFSQYNRRDFRGHIAANIEFLWKEANGISKTLVEHHIWKEVKGMNHIPRQILQVKGTVVTPYVYECFEHLRFGKQLVKVVPGTDTQNRQRSLGETLHLTAVMGSTVEDVEVKHRHGSWKESIAVGDVLGVKMDDKKTSLWKDEYSKWKTIDNCWYVLVQGIHEDKTCSRSFEILWLYKPSDTSCAKMKYPYGRELFLSDNCSCARRRIPEDDVLCKVSVSWDGRPGDSDSDFFVRQTYLHNNSFVTFNESHKQCIHLCDRLKNPLGNLVDHFRPGSTVLYIPPKSLKSKHCLEPGEIVDSVKNAKEEVTIVKRLLRGSELEGITNARPNELVYSDELVTVCTSKVQRKCFVRFYNRSEIEDGAIPAPYNRDGTGDAFYIVMRLVGEALQPISQESSVSLIQGPDFQSVPLRMRLRALDLYCGGGNFGRGLEEGGAIHNTHAVDIDENAIHTYHANLRNPNSTKLYLGSVNDMLAAALRGNIANSAPIPLPGEIDFISAGSPCPGFSILNSSRNDEKGQQNQSLVASVAAYVDVYRPKYALLENVVTMAQKGKGRDEDVLSQLICCIVGMGYQVQIFNLDAWSFGSAQSRSRLFVSVTAPGLKPPSHPNLTHSHPVGTTGRGLGMMANGFAFGERRFEPTSFEYVTAQSATADLPNIGNGRTYQCIQHPDHRMTKGIPNRLRRQIEAIPIRPYGMNFAKTWKQGLMTTVERNIFPTTTKMGRPCHSTHPASSAWGRIHPHFLFPTIATAASPTCARSGRALHWDQQRLLTVLEARRAQGFPDDEVITGTPASQWRIVGNSVARTVSLALGLSIAEAWLNFTDEIPQSIPVQAQDVQATLGPLTSADAESNVIFQEPQKKMVLEKSHVWGSKTQINHKPSLDDYTATKTRKRRGRLSQPVAQSPALKKARIFEAYPKYEPVESAKPPEILPKHPATAHTIAPSSIPESVERLQAITAEPNQSLVWLPPYIHCRPEAGQENRNRLFQMMPGRSKQYISPHGKAPKNTTSNPACSLHGIVQPVPDVMNTMLQNEQLPLDTPWDQTPKQSSKRQHTPCAGSSAPPSRRSKISKTRARKTNNESPQPQSMWAQSLQQLELPLNSGGEVSSQLVAPPRPSKICTGHVTKAQYPPPQRLIMLNEIPQQQSESDVFSSGIDEQPTLGPNTSTIDTGNVTRAQCPSPQSQIISEELLEQQSQQKQSEQLSISSSGISEQSVASHSTIGTEKANKPLYPPPLSREMLSQSSQSLLQQNPGSGSSHQSVASSRSSTGNVIKEPPNDLASKPCPSLQQTARPQYSNSQPWKNWSKSPQPQFQQQNTWRSGVASQALASTKLSTTGTVEVTMVQYPSALAPVLTQTIWNRPP